MTSNNPFTQMTKSITVSGTPMKSMTFNYSADNERVLKAEGYGTTKNSNLYIRGSNEYAIAEKINLSTTLNDKNYIYGQIGLIAFCECIPSGKDAIPNYFAIHKFQQHLLIIMQEMITAFLDSPAICRNPH